MNNCVESTLGLVGNFSTFEERLEIGISGKDSDSHSLNLRWPGKFPVYDLPRYLGTPMMKWSLIWIFGGFRSLSEMNKATDLVGIISWSTNP